MFDELTRLGDAGLLDVMRDAQRAERAAIARRLVAAGRLCQRRLANLADDREREFYAARPWLKRVTS